MKFGISTQNIIPKTHTKYLGLILDEDLIWSAHINNLKKMLSKANGLLAKTKIQYFAESTDHQCLN